MIRISATLLAFASLVACGGAGGSEFVTTTTAACIKDEGQAAAANCACTAAAVEKELTDKEKKAVLVSINLDGNAGMEARLKAMSDAGITMEEMMSIGMKLISVSAKAEAECAK